MILTELAMIVTGYASSGIEKIINREVCFLYLTANPTNNDKVRMKNEAALQAWVTRMGIELRRSR